MRRTVGAAIGAALVGGAFGLGVVTAQATADEGTARLAGDTSVGHAGHALPVVDFKAPTTANEKIVDALAALPVNLRGAARVVDYPARAGEPYPELKAGTNEWTCFPDFAPSKGDDPTCFNRGGMQWLDAYYAGKSPEVTEIGVIYRLRGGSDASLSDPSLTEPPPGADWVLYGPHMVLIPTKGTDTGNYPTAPGEHPWVMWRGTPYEHIHLPVG